MDARGDFAEKIPWGKRRAAKTLTVSRPDCLVLSRQKDYLRIFLSFFASLAFPHRIPKPSIHRYSVCRAQVFL